MAGSILTQSLRFTTGLEASFGSSYLIPAFTPGASLTQGRGFCSTRQVNMGWAGSCSWCPLGEDVGFWPSWYRPPSVGMLLSPGQSPPKGDRASPVVSEGG